MIAYGSGGGGHVPGVFLSSLPMGPVLPTQAHSALHELLPMGPVLLGQANLPLQELFPT